MRIRILPLNVTKSTPGSCVSRGSTHVQSHISCLQFLFQLIVYGFSVTVDTNQAHDLAKKAREVKKQLKELQNLANVYNNRERIFGMKVTKVSVRSCIYRTLNLFGAF